MISHDAWPTPSKSSRGHLWYDAVRVYWLEKSREWRWLKKGLKWQRERES
jgi:hypothetical protein